MKYIALVLAFTPALLFADSRSGDLNRISDSSTVLQQIMSAPDRAIPQGILSHAQCVGVIPGVKKGAFLVGAKYGKGILVCRTASGAWSAPSIMTIEGGSFGFQIGASSTDLVMVVKNRSGENKLMQDKFTLGAGAGAVAGPVGRTASAETDAELHAEILTYSRSRGVFGGVDLNGATLRPDNAANRKIYGLDVTQREILTGQVRPPAAATPLYSELNQYAKPRG